MRHARCPSHIRAACPRTTRVPGCWGTSAAYTNRERGEWGAVQLRVARGRQIWTARRKTRRLVMKDDKVDRTGSTTPNSSERKSDPLLLAVHVATCRPDHEIPTKSTQPTKLSARAAQLAPAAAYRSPLPLPTDRPPGPGACQQWRRQPRPPWAAASRSRAHGGPRPW